MEAIKPLWKKFESQSQSKEAILLYMRRSILTVTTQTGRVYDNCKMVGPDDTALCRCSKKRAKWYLARNLATVIDEDPFTIQLNFFPKSVAYAGDPFYMADKEDICVRCGSQEELTKHHIVPICYRKHLPREEKNHSSHDIVLLCDGCHQEYERHADELKTVIADEHGVHRSRPVLPNPATLDTYRAGWALRNYSDQMPDDRVCDLIQTIKDYFEVDMVSEESINEACDLDVFVGGVEYGKYIMNCVEDTQAFIIRWRQHFLAIMDPQHMPEFWDVNR